MPTLEVVLPALHPGAFTTTAATKQAAIDALALAFERGDIRVISDPVLIGELQAYEGKRPPSGYMRYSAPEGMHNGTVIALALAAWGAVVLERLAGMGLEPELVPDG